MKMPDQTNEETPVFVAITGRVMSEPELKQHEKEGWICEFSVGIVAVPEPDEEGNEKIAGYANARCRGSLARNAAESLRVGMRIAGRARLTGLTVPDAVIEFADLEPSLRYAIPQID